MECMQALSTEIRLPQRADVIISDLHGVLPLLQQHLPSIMDARSRLLAPGGNLIPKRDVLWAAVVETPQQHDRLVKPWTQERFGLHMHAASQIVTNVWTKTRVTPHQLLTKPQCWVTIDFLTTESADVSATIHFEVVRPGVALSRHELNILHAGKIMLCPSLSASEGQALPLAGAQARTYQTQRGRARRAKT